MNRYKALYYKEGQIILIKTLLCYLLVKLNIRENDRSSSLPNSSLKESARSSPSWYWVIRWAWCIEKMLMATICTRMWDGKLWDVTWAGKAARSLELRAAALSSSVKKIKQGEFNSSQAWFAKKINHIWYSETGQHKPVHRWIQAWSCRNDVIISLTESFPFNSGLKFK